MSSPQRNFFAKFSAFFFFPQVLHSIFGQAARFFTRNLSLLRQTFPLSLRDRAFFGEIFLPALPQRRGRPSGGQRRVPAGSVPGKSLPPFVERFPPQQSLWKKQRRTPLSTLSTRHFPDFPHGFLGKSISFPQLGVDFPQRMCYTIILVDPA